MEIQSDKCESLPVPSCGISCNASALYFEDFVVCKMFGQKS